MYLRRIKQPSDRTITSISQTTQTRVSSPSFSNQPIRSISRSFSIFSPSNLLISNRSISTVSSLNSLYRLNNPQIRSMSFISVATRAAARAGGRFVGLGAVGVGGAAYVSSQVDEFTGGIVGATKSFYNQASQMAGDLASNTSNTIERISNGANKTAFHLSESLSLKFQDFSSNLDNLFNKNNQQEDDDQYHEGSTGSSSSSSGSKDSKNPYFLGLSTGLGLSVDNLDRESSKLKNDQSNGLMHLTRKLIEIRSLLLSIDKDESLVLPSIVVIGSQSSGKTSVLEAIVGHEFLPKGNNMVTRRPLELTLIHTPTSIANPNRKDYVECEQFGPGQFDDFREVQRRLTRLNLDVPDSVAVDDQPINLKVYSPNVPDLSLVDLPGYVQISSMDQPEELREKINQLCDKYIRKPNIILSVCAADVDLANSPALRASKRVDPHGYRTIGVITKLDLVDPSVGASILSNDKYRLALGYVGVVCKPPQSSSSSFESRLLRRGSNSSMSTSEELSKQEFEFFRSNSDHYDQPNLSLGTDTLKQRLMKVLEESMSSSLHDITNRVSLELDETSYQYKLQYNDRAISAETYLAETMDQLKRQLVDFSKLLVKSEVRELLRRELDQKVLGLLAEIYWSDRRMVELTKLSDSKVGPEGLDPYWTHRLEAAQSRLTKGGVGRSTAELVSDEIRFAVHRMIDRQPMNYHPNVCEELIVITDDILDGLKSRAADHVEIAVMPFRYDVEIDKNDWESGRKRATRLVEEEMRLCDQFLRAEKAELRKNWRLREAFEHVREDEERLRRRAQRRLMVEIEGKKDEESLIDEPEETRPPPVLLDRARRLRDMETRLEVLRLRSVGLKSKRCKVGPESKGFCPEIFLNVLSDRLSATSTDFISIDLLNRFFSTIPHEINFRLIKKLELEDRVSEFSKENPDVRKHLELQDRKDKLERVND
ncbi:P-loop containing nucleoside triphosphate hydrolase protein [Phakopsora pachyrhizi]|nr:P-loop containing nucleoside triphosphate hydrolase protein [Phakopsora pachyrhizi]